MMLTLATIADRLQMRGSDRERSVRRLFVRHKVPIVKRCRGYLATEEQYKALIEAMTTCSPSDGARAGSSMSVVRSVSGAKRASSKNILQAAIAETMQKPIDQNSNPTLGTKSFTVVEGGRKL
jgi:hypothetical protein